MDTLLENVQRSLIGIVVFEASAFILLGNASTFFNSAFSVLHLGAHNLLGASEPFQTCGIEREI